MEPEESPRQEPEEPRRLDDHVAVFFRDSTLWPVLVVLIAAFVSFGTAILFFAVVERNPFALTALAVLGWVSADLVVRDRRRGRFGLTSRFVLALWVLSALAAAGFLYWQIRGEARPASSSASVPTEIAKKVELFQALNVR